MSFLIARCSFARHTYVSTESRRFAIGDRVDLPLSDEEKIQLCDDAYCLLAESEEQAAQIQFELVHLNFPSDGFDEMSLDLIQKPQAPKMPRSRPPALPPSAPIPNSALSPLGKMWRFSESAKPRKQK